MPDDLNDLDLVETLTAIGLKPIVIDSQPPQDEQALQELLDQLKPPEPAKP